MFIIPSQSMENTLLIGDRVVVQKITDFHRGDVVVFADPGGWLRTSRSRTRPRSTGCSSSSVCRPRARPGT